MKTFLKGLLGFFVGLFVIAVILLVALHSFLDDSLSKRQIFRLVEKHSETILADITANDFADILAIDGVTGVESGDVTAVECGGEGLASATSYYGFYYIEADKPVVQWNGMFDEADSDEMIQDGDGFSYTEMHDDNTPSDNVYYTERILPGFYYYEWHF